MDEPNDPLRHALARSRMAYALLAGADLRILEHNAALRGLSSAGEELVGRPFTTAIADAANLRGRLRGALASGEPLHDVELVVAAPDGRRYLRLEALPGGNTLTVLLADVSEPVRQRMAAEEARCELVESNERFRLAFNAAPITVFARDRDMRLTWLHGAEQHPGEHAHWLGTLPHELFHPDDAACIERVQREVMERGEPAQLSIWPRPRSGQGSAQRAFDIYVQPTYGSTGEINGVAGAMLDVTQHMQLRAALAESERQLRVAVSSAPLLLYMRDRDLRLRWLYGGTTELDRDALLGSTLGEVVAPEDEQQLRQLYLEVMASGEPKQRLLRLNNPRLLDTPWHHFNVHPLRAGDGSVCGIICAAYDVSELMETRATLATREAMMRLAIEAAEVGTWEFDVAAGMLRYVASAGKLYGLPTEETVASSDFFYERVHPDDREMLRRRFREALEGSGCALHNEFRIVRPDGGLRWIASRGRIERDSAGQPVRISGVDVDSTDERQLRERLERFARTVAHDFRSPLQTVLGFGELLANSALQRLSWQEREHLAVMLEAAQQMDELIEGLLAYTYAVHKGVTDEVELEQALEQALSALEGPITETQAQITHDPLPKVRGYRVLLAQILQNLIANAIKYAGDGAPNVHIGATRAGSEWIIEVRDYGIGIPLERQERLFEAFSRAHLDGDHPGIGLGLSLVKNAVEHHGGRVWLDSAPGVATRFYFSLPAEAQSASAELASA